MSHQERVQRPFHKKRTASSSEERAVSTPSPISILWIRTSMGLFWEKNCFRNTTIFVGEICIQNAICKTHEVTYGNICNCLGLPGDRGALRVDLKVVPCYDVGARNQWCERGENPHEYDIDMGLGGSWNGGSPKLLVFLKILLKWMMTGGTPILENLHITPIQPKREMSYLCSPTERVFTRTIGHQLKYEWDARVILAVNHIVLRCHILTCAHVLKLFVFGRQWNLMLWFSC